MLIFAEGTTTNGTSILKFRRGAFEALKTVTPTFSIMQKYVILIFYYWPKNQTNQYDQKNYRKPNDENRMTNESN